jgi:hypothetical protein
MIRRINIQPYHEYYEKKEEKKFISPLEKPKKREKSVKDKIKFYL